VVRWLVVLLLLCSGGIATLPVGAQATRNDPTPFGTPVMVGDWSVRVSRVQFNADSVVRSVNQFNDPPPAGYHFVMALLDATYLGTETGNLPWDVTFKVVGRTNRAFDQGDPGCGVVPRDLFNAPEAYPGGRVTANACWAVPQSDMASLVMFSDTLVGQNPGRQFFALSDPGSARTSVAIADPQPSATRTQVADARAAAGRDRRIGGRHNPIPVGQSKAVGEWTLRVRNVTPDATNQVLAENQFNDLPAQGHQFVLVTLDARLSGSAADSETFWTGMSLKVLGPRALAFDQSQADCGVIPDDLFSAPEVFPGGRIQGNLCWDVRQAEADSLLLIVKPDYGPAGDQPVFFALS
jgi:hypothetical protein